MLRIITWDKDCKPNEKILQSLGWDTITLEPWNLHPMDYLESARRWVASAQRSPDDRIIIQTIDTVYFNALRVALRETWVSNEVHVYEFNDGEPNHAVTVIDRDGRMDYWPDVFEVQGQLLRRLI